MTDSIPYGSQSISSEDVDAVIEALHGVYLTTGPTVPRFEAELSRRMDGVGVAAVSSGTSALHAAYASLGLRSGEVMLTTPLTFVATVSTALTLGATVRLADIESRYLTLDPDAVEDAIDPRTRIVTAVDYAGNVADLDRLAKVCSVAGAVLVEDAAHSLGGVFLDRPVGSIAPVTTFSFHPVKTITTTEGGAVAALDGEVLDRVRKFRNHGLVRDPQKFVVKDEGDWHQEIQSLGLNYRLSDVSAALGISQLARLVGFVARRKELFDRYQAGLGEVQSLQLPTARGGCEPAWHLYPVRVRDGRRRALYDHLRARGIHCQVHYLPLHLQPLLQDLGFRAGQFPVAELAYKELLSLPLFPSLTDEDQDRVIADVRSFFG